MYRNLLYNCYPNASAPDVWRDNVQRLREYRSVFNGRKIVLVKLDHTTEPEEAVHDEFGWPDAEFVVWPNDPILSETAGFFEMLESLESDRGDEITFYAHTKGSGKRKTAWDQEKRTWPEEHHESIRQWRNRMYHECLSNPDRIDSIMRKYAACGCYLRENHLVEGKAYWIFAGTFWWVNHGRFFSREWRMPESYFKETPAHWHRETPELHLSTVFDVDEIHCLHNGWRHFYEDLFYNSECPACGNVITLNDELACPKCGRQVSRGGFADMYI